MQKALPREVGVDKRGDEANLGATEPQAHILGPVLHEKCHALAGLVALPQKVVGHAIAVGLQVAKCPHLVLENERCLLAVPADSSGEGLWDCHVAFLVVVDQGEKSDVAEGPPEKQSYLSKKGATL